jgi:hypothetical protein
MICHDWWNSLKLFAKVEELACVVVGGAVGVVAIVRLVDQHPHACKVAGLALKRTAVQVAAIVQLDCCGARPMCVSSRSNGVRVDWTASPVLMYGKGDAVVVYPLQVRLQQRRSCHLLGHSPTMVVQCSGVQHTPLHGCWHAQAPPPVLHGCQGTGVHLVASLLRGCCGSAAGALSPC